LRDFNYFLAVESNQRQYLRKRTVSRQAVKMIQEA
jgi:hypothetical protein